MQGERPTLNHTADEHGQWVVALASPKTSEQLQTEARAWRNAELYRADIELNKVQDGDGVGTVTAWRAYRSALRKWPESETFPETKPSPPDA
jgi:hypothetical protein